MAHPQNRLTWIDSELSRLAATDRLRSFKIDRAAVRFGEDSRAIQLSSNNYLGLANHPRIAQAAIDAQLRLGSGGQASRLTAGNYEEYAHLEREVAEWKGFESAVVFGSGYQANIGAITSLVGEGDAIFSDELNHASIIDGCRLSRASIYVYRHCDKVDLARLLEQHVDQHRRSLFVTESIFSMDGDIAPLDDLLSLAIEHGCMTLVDDAHATGVFGAQGAGLACQAVPRPDLIVGTFSKALGCYGAFVASSKDIGQLITNRARSLIYTTALPPAVIAAVRESVAICAGVEGESLRAALAFHVKHFVERFTQITGQSPGQAPGQTIETCSPHRTPIVPWIIGSDSAALHVADLLRERNIIAVPIRPPTVPENRARIRLSFMATHTASDLKNALAAIAEITAQLR